MKPDPLTHALIEEATKKSGLIWAQGATAQTPHPLWHVWHENAAYVVGDGPGEQPLPGLRPGGTAAIIVPSKDTRARLITWRADITELAPASPAWQSAVAQLAPKRLNAPDAENLPARWARECRVLRLTPTKGQDAGNCPP